MDIYDISRVIAWGSACAVVALVVWVLRRAIVGANVQPHFVPTKRNVAVLNECRELNAYYPTPWLLNGHLHTILAAMLRERPSKSVFKLDREMIEEPHGRIALDWFVSASAPQTQKAPAPILLFCPGLNGASSECYIQWSMMEAAAQGFRPVCVNWRGCAGTALEKPVTFSGGGDVIELKAAIDHIRGSVSDETHLFVAGFSLGGVTVGKYLCDEADAAGRKISGAAICASPLDMHKYHHYTTGSPLGFIYDRMMASGMRRYVKKHEAKLTEVDWIAADFHNIVNAKSVRELDERLLMPLFGFPSVEAYYDAATSFHELGSRVSVPTLILNAKDDPIYPADGIPIHAAEANEHVIVISTDEGGHIGWAEGWGKPRGASWAERLVCQFLRSLHDSGSRKDVAPSVLVK